MEDVTLSNSLNEERQAKKALEMDEPVKPSYRNIDVRSYLDVIGSHSNKYASLLMAVAKIKNDDEKKLSLEKSFDESVMPYFVNHFGKNKKSELELPIRTDYPIPGFVQFVNDLESLSNYRLDQDTKMSIATKPQIAYNIAKSLGIDYKIKDLVNPLE